MIRIDTRQLTDRYSFCDPAGRSKEAVKRVRSRAAIVTIAVEPELCRIIVLQTWASRAGTDQITDQIFNVNQQYHPRVFGVEANAMQQLYAGSIAREARQRGIFIPLLAVPQPTRIDKEFRIRTALQDLWRQGRIIIGRHMHELRVEIASFPTGQTNDLIDALASCVRMVPLRPRRQAESEHESSVLAYLRKTGAPQHVIEQRAREGRREGLLRNLRDSYSRQTDSVGVESHEAGGTGAGK